MIFLKTRDEERMAKFDTTLWKVWLVLFGIFIGMVVPIERCVSGCGNNETIIENSSLISETNATDNLFINESLIGIMVRDYDELCSSECALFYTIWKDDNRILDSIMNDSFIISAGLTEENCEKCR